MPRIVDLDDVHGLEQALDELARRRALGDADPPLRAALLRGCNRLDDRDARLASTIREELDAMHPHAVCAGRWRDLVEDRSSLGAFPRRDSLDAPTLEEWLQDDPRRLVRVVHEMLRFSHDLPRVTAAALELADRAGLDPELADKVVCAGLRAAVARAG